MWRLCPDSCQRKVAAQLFFSREVDRGEQWGSEELLTPFGRLRRRSITSLLKLNSEGQVVWMDGMRRVSRLL